MFESFEYKGFWWLPETPDIILPGTLTFHPENGSTLEIIKNEDLPFQEQSIKYELLLGVNESGKKFTLIKCLLSSRSSGFVGISISHYNIQKIFIGAHFNNINEIMFSRFVINYSYLNKWFGITGLKGELFFEKNVDGDKLSKATYTYVSPDTITIKLNNLKTININTSANIPLGFESGLNIKEKTELTILNHNSQLESFDDMMDLVYLLGYFFSIAVMKPVYILSITCFSNNFITKMPDKKDFFNPIQVYYHSNKIMNIDQFSLEDMIFSFNDIKNNFEKYISNWIDTYNILKPSLDLFFNNIYHDKSYLHNKFLNFAQSIETYHRLRFLGKFESDKSFLTGSYEILNEAIQNNGNLNSDYKDSLKGKLKYLNEYSLRKRLKELSERYNSILTIYINNISVFINYIVDTRNYLTHYDESLKKRSLDEWPLYYLTEALRFILEIIILSEIGFSNDQIINMIKDKRRYDTLKIKLKEFGI